MKEMNSCLNVDIEENSNYPDWEPLGPLFLRNCRDNKEDLLEISLTINSVVDIIRTEDLKIDNDSVNFGY